MSHVHREDSSYWSRRHTEAVVLDIGEDVGALVLYVPRHLHGSEIELSRVGQEDRRVHTAVLERAFNGRTAYAAVYPELAAGTYRVWIDSEPTVTITAGSVAELDCTA
jgi:hypothetical protein